MNDKIMAHDAKSVVPTERVGLPAPRLQLRWEANNGQSDHSARGGWLCFYELVLPLAEGDIRREIYEDGEQVGERSELVVPIKGPSWRGSERMPCIDWTDGDAYFFDSPYRDGVHAKWDAPHMGNPPIYVIAPDGTPIREATQDRTASSVGTERSGVHQPNPATEEGG